jgi:glycosyltransferase involved in cell wall biosynthesis
MRQTNTMADGPTARTVLILCPGGLEDGGGIGRQMGYFLRADLSGNTRLQYRVIDTRGPWFLGAAPHYKVASVAYLIRAAWAMLGAKLSGAPCVAHVNITGRGSTIRKTVLMSAVRLVGMRYVLHVHDPAYADDYRARGPVMRKVVRGLFHGAQSVIVLGSHDKLLLGTALRLPAQKIIVLPNAVPDPGPPPLKHHEAAMCQLLFLGYLSARKGVPELLQALASPSVVTLPWQATLAGGGPIDEYRAMAVSLGLAGRVNFPGWLEGNAVRSALEAADILCLPSHAEGLAMAILEGLAHGLAIITTPVGAHGEAIDHGVSGILVPPGDVAALAAALRRVIGDAGVRQHLQAGARRRFQEKFNVQPYATRLSQLHAACFLQTEARMRSVLRPSA